MPIYTEPVTKIEHKFACHHCIRGHRSTNCSHNDRPLYYIRKKGRPVSQCNQCRALRKNRSLHTRCECPSRVKSRGQDASLDAADLPEGMNDQGVKDFIERLHTNQKSCHNCNSSHCRCSSGTDAVLAPSSSSPANSTSPNPPPPYSVPFSPNVMPAAPAEMRSGVPVDTVQHTYPPQFTGMPSFNHMLRTDNSTHDVPRQYFSTQAQNFQRRSEQLIVAQRRLLQVNLLTRDRNRVSSSDFRPLPPLVQGQQQDLQYRRTPFPYNFGPSAGGGVLTRPDLDLYLQQEPYPNPPISEPDHNDLLRYFNSSPFPHFGYITDSVFRPPAPMDVLQRTGSTSSVNPELNSTEIALANSKMGIMDAHHVNTGRNSTEATMDQHPLPKSRDDGVNTTHTPPLNHDEVQSVVSEYAPTTVAESNARTGGAGLQSYNPVKLDPDLQTSEIFSAFEGIEDQLENETGDDDWLFDLKTQCAQPGTVCECGDTCCCPGCFTHANNPGDRRVLNTVVNKLGMVQMNPSEETYLKGNPSAEKLSETNNTSPEGPRQNHPG